MTMIATQARWNDEPMMQEPAAKAAQPLPQAWLAAFERLVGVWDELAKAPMGVGLTLGL